MNFGAWEVRYLGCNWDSVPEYFIADRRADWPLYWRAGWISAFSTHRLIHGQALVALDIYDIGAFDRA